MEELRRKLSAMELAIRDLQSRPFRIPIVAADPPTTDPTNIWMFADGRIRARHWNTTRTAYTIREWVASAPGSSTSAQNEGAPPSAPLTRVLTAVAQWSQSYQQAGAQRTDDGVYNLYYGNGGDANGRNRSLIGFDYTTIASSLASSTIKSVSLTITSINTYFSDVGADVYLGIHNFSAKPATWTGGGIPMSMAVRANLHPSETTTVDLTLDFAQAIRDGWGKGIALEVPGDSPEFYGYAAGFGSSYPAPTLNIEYAK